MIANFFEIQSKIRLNDMITNVKTPSKTGCRVGDNESLNCWVYPGRRPSKLAIERVVRLFGVEALEDRLGLPRNIDNTGSNERIRDYS